jgi:hypothetical protein
MRERNQSYSPGEACEAAAGDYWSLIQLTILYLLFSTYTFFMIQKLN